MPQEHQWHSHADGKPYCWATEMQRVLPMQPGKYGTNETPSRVALANGRDCGRGVVKRLEARKGALEAMVRTISDLLDEYRGQPGPLRTVESEAKDRMLLQLESRLREVEHDAMVVARASREEVNGMREAAETSLHSQACAIWEQEELLRRQNAEIKALKMSLQLRDDEVNGLRRLLLIREEELVAEKNEGKILRNTLQGCQAENYSLPRQTPVQTGDARRRPVKTGATLMREHGQAPTTLGAISGPCEKSAQALESITKHRDQLRALVAQLTERVLELESKQLKSGRLGKLPKR